MQYYNSLGPGAVYVRDGKLVRLCGIDSSRVLWRDGWIVGLVGMGDEGKHFIGKKQGFEGGKRGSQLCRYLKWQLHREDSLEGLKFHSYLYS